MKRHLASIAAVCVAATIAVTAQIRQSAVHKDLLGVGQPPPALGSSDAFFDDNVLHDIFITINSKDWAALQEHYLDNTYYPVDFRWRDQTVRNAGIRSRGTGSRSGTKPGLRVDFDRYVTDQKFLDLKSFVLRNNTQDASSMHERISMQLFRRVGITAPRVAHAKFYVNNEYQGLYAIVESIDKTFLKRTFGEDTGYLYKYDYPPGATPYYFEDKGSDGSTYVPQPFKPETHESDPHPETIVGFVQTLNQTADASFKAAMQDYVDLQRFVRHVAVEQFLGELDGILSTYGGMNNYYWYRYDNRKLFTFIAWDKSEAFKGGPGYNVFHEITDVPAAQQNRLLNRSLSFSDLKSYFLDSLMDCVRTASEPAAGDPRGWLEREVEREYRQIRDAALTDPTKPFSNDQFEAEVNAMRAFAQQRAASVTAQVNAAR